MNFNVFEVFNKYYIVFLVILVYIFTSYKSVVLKHEYKKGPGGAGPGTGPGTGGTAGGSANDRIFLRVTGIVFLKHASQTTATLGSFGTVSGWTTEIAFSGTNDMHLSVTVAANMNLSWSATLHLYEMRV